MKNLWGLQLVIKLGVRWILSDLQTSSLKCWKFRSLGGLFLSTNLQNYDFWVQELKGGSLIYKPPENHRSKLEKSSRNPPIVGRN